MSADTFCRKITAIMSADVVGYGKLMGDDEAATVKALSLNKNITAALIGQHRAESYRRLGRYQEAIDTCKILLEGNPHATHALRAYITLTCAHSALGREKDARKAVAQILKTKP
jgi:tetratricopeptide (TPR) repeat protein